MVQSYVAGVLGLESQSAGFGAQLVGAHHVAGELGAVVVVASAQHGVQHVHEHLLQTVRPPRQVIDRAPAGGLHPRTFRRGGVALPLERDGSHRLGRCDWPVQLENEREKRDVIRELTATRGV